MINYQKQFGVVAIFVLLISCGETRSQCTILVQDTFRLGLRPHGGGGQLRETVLHETLSGFWPLVPAGVQWTSVNVSGQPTWAWAATSTDPMEVDPQDPSNGTAFGGGHAVALLPFSAPPGQAAFALSADLVLGFNQAEPVFLGFTSSNAVTDNFIANGALWMSLDGQGNWNVYANASGTLLASGNAGYGQLGSGWMHLVLQFNPATSSVSGRVAADTFGPLPVTLQRAMSFVGFEAHDGFFNDVNNFLVRSGAEMNVAVQGTTAACDGSAVTLNATTNATTPTSVLWLRDGVILGDGATGFGSVISGATTLTLTVSGVSFADGGAYQCSVSNACDSVMSSPVALTVFSGGSGDGNASGGLDGNDIQDLADTLVNGGAPSPSYCAYDMNANGVVDLLDVGLFVNLLLAQ